MTRNSEVIRLDSSLAIQTFLLWTLLLADEGSGHANYHASKMSSGQTCCQIYIYFDTNERRNAPSRWLLNTSRCITYRMLET